MALKVQIAESKGGICADKYLTKLVPEATITIDELAEEIAADTNLLTGHVKGAIIAMSQQILQYCCKGHKVAFDEIGTFTLGASFYAVPCDLDPMEKDEFIAVHGSCTPGTDMLKAIRLNFEPCAKIKQELKNLTFITQQ